MKTTKNLLAIIVLAIAVAPVFLTFNEDINKIWMNLVGMAYAVLLFKYGKRIAPPFVRDYLDE